MSLPSKVPGALVVATAISLAAFAQNTFAGDADKGRVLSETCRGCHGIEGYKNTYPSYHVPRLAGQNADYIVAALKAYQSGDRSHDTMHAQAASLTDEEKADIGAYFESLGLEGKR